MEVTIEKTRAFFERQIRYFEQNKTDFLDLYAHHMSDSANPRKQTEQLLDTYLAAVRDALQGQGGIPDFVTIGSEVTIIYEEDGMKERYKIGLPENSNPDENCVSFLSPLGRQLLMAKKGQHLSIETPGEPMQVTVSEVKLVLDNE